MMAWLCNFRPCQWRFLCNVLNADDAPCGLYQCATCKTMSTGSKRPFVKGGPT